ncbi:MAG: hypothetical protein ACK4MF_07650 [Hyphomicrobiaceae bacterium]
MTTLTELRSGLMANAKRAVSLMSACTNEESTKLYLVMPFIGLLGYDYTDPREVYPEHAADFAKDNANKVDLAIFREGVPAIAVEVKKVGADVAESRGQLAGYFNALASVKLGVVTNGIVYAFYVDSIAPNMMDDEPFLTIDLETIAGSGFADEETLDALLSVTKSWFNPALMAEIAHVRLVKRRLRKVFLDEARGPTEGFCRFMLERIGIKNVRAAAIARYYAPLVHAAFEESLVLPVVRHLKADQDAQSRNFASNLTQIAQRVVTTERENAIFAYVRRRLAFLISDEVQFNAIETIGYKDYVGKFAVYYQSPRKGRLFDFIEGADGYDKFIFPEPFGEIVTNNIYEIDDALRTVFVTRVAEIGAAGLTQRLARIA